MDGIFLFDGKTIEKVVVKASVALASGLEPDEAPGTGGQKFTALYSEFSSGALSLNNLGSVAFIAGTDGQAANGVFIAVPQLSNQLYFAQFANGVTNGGSFQSRLILTNPSRALPVLGQVNFFGDSGKPIALSFKELGGGNGFAFNIPSLGSAVFTTDGQGPPVNGFAQVSSDNPLNGVVVFSLPTYGTSGVGSSIPLTEFIAPVSIKSASGINTAIAIANPSERSVRVELVLHKSTGEAVENGRATVTLPANGHIARFVADTVDSFFPGTSADEFEGTVTATVTSIFGSVVATAVQVGPGQFTTVPVSPLR